ncbi:MAG: hypothetical protein EOP45_18450 [Sphingobacteriaceae bacterium]|nr:MAG: hypothetical protein EOP45_18450 [Sphingobacteriaceae bacterium]
MDEDVNFLSELRQHRFNTIIIYTHATLQNENICCNPPTRTSRFIYVPKRSTNHLFQTTKQGVPIKLLVTKEEFMQVVKKNDSIISNFGSYTAKRCTTHKKHVMERRVYEVKDGKIRRVSVDEYRDTLTNHNKFQDT